MVVEQNEKASGAAKSPDAGPERHLDAIVNA
jgi:hypothetical protein